MSDTSTSLFARPSFLEGIARILDFGNTLHEYNRGGSSEEADAEAVAVDVASLRHDFEQSRFRLTTGD